MMFLDNPLGLFVVTFLLLWLGAGVGILLRGGRRELPESMREDYGIIVGATLTLLGLIIGFTFSMATTRYDLRKNLEEEEANAIGTEYVRADFLPAQDASRLRTLLRQYTDLRIEFYKADQDKLPQVNRSTTGIQNQLWSVLAASAKANPSPLAAVAATGMNDVLNSQGYTQAAWWNRIPKAAWALLYIIAIVSNVLLGYGAHGKALALSLVLPLLVSISFLLISDIDSPRGGIIRVQPQNLAALADSLKAP
ncbi:hypothetical protein ACPOL_1810 [Acidisarcina polymorpha]|uniref:DUF4239 domain-containing protein n=1 Tax=Acidisarcina polymorpha TaxID=2211140 RepID=A0A2Z5FWL1_9BACT|nr:hypothetical protein [Acidisarcina polymorpha]AXC11152.1 hypothetical protein ACPOL_1810 [Acidisarcina polymorpha]